MKIRVEFEITPEAQSHLDEHGLCPNDAIGDALQNLADSVCSAEFDLKPGMGTSVVWRPAFLNDDIVLGELECLGDEPALEPVAGLATVTLTLTPTPALMAAAARATEPDQWPDVVAAVLEDAAEMVKTGSLPLGRSWCVPKGEPLTAGQIAAHGLYYYPANAARGDEVRAGVLQVRMADDAVVHDDAWHDARCGGCQMLWAECSCDDEDADEQEAEDDTPTEPEEGDYVLQPTGPLGGCTAVSVDGRHRETFSPGETSADEQALAWIRADMAANEYWPNVWSLSDHGNYTLLTLSPLDAPENGGTGGTMGDAAAGKPSR
jgi:hypothetical protein